MFDTILEVLNGLVTAINNLSLTVTNMIAVNCSQSSTCGTSPPQPEAVEEAPPPPGYSEYVTSEKCKAANLVIDDLLTLLGQLKVNNVEEIVTFGIGALTALFVLVVTLLPTGPLALAVGVIGTVGNLIAFFLVQTVNLEEFIALIGSLRQELICALYNSPNTTTANTDFRAVLSDGGATASALALLDAINLINGLTLLYFSKDDISAAWQARLDGYVAETDCESCGFLDCDWIISPDSLDPDVETGSGYMGSGTPLQDGSQFVVTAVQRDGGAYVASLCTRAYMESGCGIFNNGCACAGCVQLELVAITTLTNWSLWAVKCIAGLTAQSTPPLIPGAMTDYVYVYWQNPNPFTVTLRVAI